MGLELEEAVALSARPTASSPTVSNEFFTMLLANEWERVGGGGAAADAPAAGGYGGGEEDVDPIGLSVPPIVDIDFSQVR